MQMVSVFSIITAPYRWVLRLLFPYAAGDATAFPQVKVSLTEWFLFVQAPFSYTHLDVYKRQPISNA